MKLGLFFALFALTSTGIYANTGSLDHKIQQALNQHFKEYQAKEYFSGAALSVLIPNNPIKSYYVGKVSHADSSEPISSKTLFQIGSITKSFTAALLLQAEQDKHLQILDTLNQWLPEYSHWSSLSIEQLLNMTSGLPNYSNTPNWNATESADLQKVWTPSTLIHFVYIPQFDVPLMKGYYYSNTNYLLAALILEKALKVDFGKQLRGLIHKANLRNTLYPIPYMDKNTLARLASGYNYNPYDNPELVGTDVRFNNLSWAGSAGGLVSNTEDIIKWVQALFIGDLLPAEQKQQLMRTRSILTGELMAKPSKANPIAYGLGVVHAYRDAIGEFWYYEGKTLGFRALYIYVPCNQIIIATVFNSATNGKNDAIHKVAQDVYNLVLTDNPKLICKNSSL